MNDFCMLKRELPSFFEVLDRKTSMYKGPEIKTSVVCWRSSKVGVRQGLIFPELIVKGTTQKS